MEYYYDEEDNRENENFSAIQLFIIRIYNRLYEKMKLMPSFLLLALEDFCNFENITELAEKANVIDFVKNEANKSKSELEKIIENGFYSISKICLDKYSKLGI